MKKLGYIIDSYPGLQPGTEVGILASTHSSILVKDPTKNLTYIVPTQGVITTQANSTLVERLMTIVEYSLKENWSKFETELFLAQATKERTNEELKEALAIIQGGLYE